MAIFTNQASLSYNDVTVNSNVATGELLEVLAAEKTAVLNQYTAGDRITYVFSAINSGPAPLNNLTLTDDLGTFTNGALTLTPLTYVEDSFRYYVNGVLQTSPVTVTAGPPLTVSGISIPAGGNALLIYVAEINRFAPLGVNGSVLNTATLAGTGASVTATEVVTTADRPDLTITKSISPDTVTENSRVTYTFAIRNYGNRDVVATDNATVTDTFDPILTDLAVTYQGAGWTVGTNYTYDEATGLFQTVPSQITVPAATYRRDDTTGEVITEPGVVVLTVTGTI